MSDRKPKKAKPEKRSAAAGPARRRTGRKTSGPAAPEKRYRRHPDVAHRIIDGTAVIVVPSTQSMHTLNEVGSFIWQTCEGKTESEIAAAVAAEFDVDEATARADFATFAAELIEKKMLVAE